MDPHPGMFSYLAFYHYYQRLEAHLIYDDEVPDVFSVRLQNLALLHLHLCARVRQTGAALLASIFPSNDATSLR